ncbi:hypothetical protein FPQ18DRAFT_394075 [Pyronema domesticum]|uniref:Uncharacterized protein n=1 Tax=Pyronema omphalodes (strain CBS 100304) TaxID=1076935 RepID=U4LXY2_PYROM|nr:hypothetical protein FPQ18DRAFT_394075 [Pyronema domesticum]CCX34668.1 Protein of unknown function [Pyronema omphalodes CBS 100304]
MKFTLLAIVSLISLTLAAPDAPAPDAPKTMVGGGRGRNPDGSYIHFAYQCSWSTSDAVGAKMLYGILSCCEKSDLTGCKEQPFNVDCKKKGWTENCCHKEKMGVDKDGRGGKCSKHNEVFTAYAGKVL